MKNTCRQNAGYKTAGCCRKNVLLKSKRSWTEIRLQERRKRMNTWILASCLYVCVLLIPLRAFGLDLNVILSCLDTRYIFIRQYARFDQTHLSGKWENPEETNTETCVTCVCGGGHANSTQKESGPSNLGIKPRTSWLFYRTTDYRWMSLQQSTSTAQASHVFRLCEEKQSTCRKAK